MSTVIMASIAMVGSFCVFLMIGVPIAISLGACSLVAALTLGLPLDIVIFPIAQQMFSGLDAFTFIAIPFFILSGNIMNRGGIAVRLVDLAKLLVGRLPGSLAHTNIVANMLFGSVSGSSIAAAAAIGSIMAPLQEKEGYDRGFSATVNTCSAPTGVLIPPSGPLILYSLVSGGTSIAALFVAGYIPGVLMGLSVMVVAGFYAWRHNYPRSSVLTVSQSVRVILRALPPLSLIVVVIGGIIAGVFTATEGAAIAVAYSLFLTFFYKEMRLADIPLLLGDTLKGSAMILFLIATSGIMGWVMAYAGIPQFLAQSVLSVSDNPIIILLIMNITLLLVGIPMDLTPAVLIFTPIFLPIAVEIGMSPVHFGIMMIFNLGFGNITPPVGSILFMACAVAKVKMEELFPFMLPFFVSMIIALMLVTYIPALSLYLPTLLGLM